MGAIIQATIDHGVSILEVNNCLVASNPEFNQSTNIGKSDLSVSLDVKQNK